MSSEITRLQDGVHAARVGGQAAAQPPPPPLQLPSQFRPQPLPTDWPAPSADAGGRDEMLAREISRADQQLSLMQQHMPPNSGPIPPPMPPAGGLSYTSSVPVARPQPTSSGYGGPLQQTSSGYGAKPDPNTPLPVPPSFLVWLQLDPGHVAFLKALVCAIACGVLRG